MMEPSEQCSYKNEDNAEDMSAVDPAIRPEEEEVHEEEQVLFLQVQDNSSDQATLILQQEGVDFNGHHFLIEHDGEYLVVIQDQLSEEESRVEAVEDAKNKLGNEEQVMDDVENSEVLVDEPQVDNDTVVEAVEHHVLSGEDSNGMAFISTPSAPTVDLPAGEEHEKLLHLAVVAQELQSKGDHNAKTQLIKDSEYPQVESGGSVIVSQIQADADSASMFRTSENEVSSSTEVASEQDSQSCTDKASTNPDALLKNPPNERKTSFSCISSSRPLDNTVSVIHTTSSGYINENLDKSIEKNFISNDCDVQNESDIYTTKSDKSEDSVSALHINLSNDNCSNTVDNFQNPDEDSELSQNCVLDNAKDTDADHPAFDEDSIPAVELPRNRYGIMDSLNKEKRNAFYDVNTSEEMEDTVNSSSRSTNITDDVESVCENNFNEAECNNNGEVVSEGDPSPEMLKAGDENSSLKYEGKNMSYAEDSKSANQAKRTGQVLLGKRKLRSFNLSNENSNSKCSAFSDDNLSSNSLPSKDASSVKKKGKRGRPILKRSKKGLDAYEFEDSSTNADQDNKLLPELENKTAGEGTDNSNVPSAEILGSEKENDSHKLTFHEALSSVLDKEEETDKTTQNDSLNSDHSAELFIDASVSDDSKVNCENEKEINNDVENVHVQPVDNPLRKGKALDERSMNENGVSDLVELEENLVKPPKKTYIRKRKWGTGGENQLNNKNKIELFSGDGLTSANGNDNSTCTDNQKDNESVLIEEFRMDDDHMESNVQSKVSATYERKQTKVPPIVRAKRTRSLRPRSSKTSEALESEAGEPSLCDLTEQLNSPTKGDSEAYWGAILLGTQFNSKSCSADTPAESSGKSPTLASQADPSAISSTGPDNSPPSRKRKRPSWFTTPNSQKSQHGSGKQFDKLIKSSPTKVKSYTSSDKKKLRDKVKKQAMSLCDFLPSTTSQIHRRRKIKASKAPNVVASSTSNSKNLKTAEVKYLGLKKRFDALTAETETLICDNNCGFSSSRPGHIYLHNRLTCTELDSSDIEPNKLMCDMDKRQSIRGETKIKEKVEEQYDGSSSNWLEPQPSCSKTYESYTSNKRQCEKKSEKHDNDYFKKNFGFDFAKKDIVWVLNKRQYWPAVAWGTKNEEALFYVVTSVDETELLTIPVESIAKKVHIFDDVTWSKKVLEGRNSNKSNNFIKAVQKANSYYQKKFLNEPVDAKTFFKIEDRSEISESNELVETSDVEMDRDFAFVEERVIKRLDVDIHKVLKCIRDKRCDKHVIAIHQEKVASKRHHIFTSPDCDVTQLEDMSWFGPLKKETDMQLKLYDHFYELYKKNIPCTPDVSYIYKVWIPEGIIKAISLVYNISLVEAEIHFFKQDDTYDMLEDPLFGGSTDPFDYSL